MPVKCWHCDGRGRVIGEKGNGYHVQVRCEPCQGNGYLPPLQRSD